MIKLFISFLFLFSCSLCNARAIVLSPGRSMEWKIPSGAPISVSDGSIIHVTDLGKHVKVTARKLGVFAAAMTPEITEQAEIFFKRRLMEAHLPELAVSFQPDAVVTMPLEPADLKSRVDRALSAYGFRAEVSAAALSLEPLVRVKLVVAEFRKDKETQIGISWPSSVHAQITWKQYGVVLKIKPKADFSGRMSIGLETEVSSIDRSNMVDGIPGLFTNRIETHFDLTTSRTIVLSGLIKKEWGDAMQGLPGLSNIPVLGALFGSRDFQEQRSELVVFVTPEVARPDQESL
jgi:Flp pilus assembly secretin CpaC